MAEVERVAGSYGVVVIGRNEGERLRKCLESVGGQAARGVVYVDSGSTDGSVMMAKSMGSEVVELDLRIPFTAARARNEGFRRMRQLATDLPYVQFVDGDCEVVPGWLEVAVAFLDAHPEVAAVCGRRRERHPERSIYNVLCDIEWDTPVGEAKACGGDVMMRVEALAAAGGYRPSLIAGEEPELCVRLRAADWRIWRLEAEMTLHDAAMNRFGQWWKRAKRGGYAFAEGAWLHGAPPEKHCVSQSRRALLWGAFLPAFILAAGSYDSFFLGLLVIYPAQVVRLAFRDKAGGRRAWWRATFLILAKFPEALGLLSFFLNRILGRRGALIEYK